MPNPMEVLVQVFLHPGGPQGDFHFETTDLPMGGNNFLYFRNWHFPGFCIHYELQEPTHGYRFPESSLFPPNPPNQHLRAALYAQPHPGCPTSASHWGQFAAQSVENSGRTLVVRNKNQTPLEFGYTLRVTSDGGVTYLPLDPGGLNKNGSASVSVTSTVIAVAVGTMAATVFVLYSLNLLSLG